MVPRREIAGSRVEHFEFASGELGIARSKLLLHHDNRIISGVMKILLGRDGARIWPIWETCPRLYLMVDGRKHAPCVPDISRQVAGINPVGRWASRCRGLVSKLLRWVARVHARAASLGAARLSPERRFEISVIGSFARWYRDVPELDQIDRHLNSLALVQAHAYKNKDVEAYQRAIQAQLPWIKLRLIARRLKEADERAAEQRRLEEAVETVCVFAGCRCGGNLPDHETQCVVRNCKCYGTKHLLLRRAGPLSSYVRDLRPDENPAG